MTLDQIQQILHQGEGINIEFKEARGSVPSTFYDSVVSFANTDGGVILLGVDDVGHILGIELNKIDKLITDILTTIHNPECIYPSIPLNIEKFNLNEVWILCIQVLVSSQVHSYKGKIFIRENESDFDISLNQHLVSNLYLKKRNQFSETIIYPALSILDFDEELFIKAKSYIRSNKADHPFLNMTFESLLKNSQLFFKNFETGKEGYTIGAVLLFGKDSVIQSILPAYQVDVFVRINNKENWDDRLSLKTNLLDTYIEMNSFINRHLPDKFFTEGTQRVDLRNKIFREIVANIIIHRDYTRAEPSVVNLFKDEVIATNPNIPRFHGLIDKDHFTPYPKNPIIRRFFTVLGWAEEAGSGIININKYVPIYSPKSKPLFIENEMFETRIPLAFYPMSLFSSHFQKWLGLPEITLTHIENGLANIPLKNNPPSDNWEELILDLVPSWNLNGTQQEILDWPDNQVFRVEEIKMIPSWNQNGIQLLRKKAMYLICILVLCSKPIKMGTLLSWIDYKNEKSFRDKYLKPLRNCGFIDLTNKEKPTDPENKYCITDLGRLFLTGQL